VVQKCKARRKIGISTGNKLKFNSLSLPITWKRSGFLTAEQPAVAGPRKVAQAAAGCSAVRNRRLAAGGSGLLQRSEAPGGCVMATMRMTTTRGKTFDWEESKPIPHAVPVHGTAWSLNSKHVKIMEKIRPPSPLRPKAAVPTAKDLQRLEESKMRCFNGPEMIDLLRTVHKENSSSSLRSTSKQVLLHNNTSIPMDPQTMPREDAATLRRKEILDIQRREDDELRQEGLRKAIANRKARKEREFQEAYAKLKDERENFVERRSEEPSEMGVDQYLQNKKDAALQKKKALYTEWSECVFKNIQDQLIDRVDTMSELEIQERRRDLFQRYMDAAAAKGGGLFLDIVIENEYNPFTWKKDTLKYRAKPAVVSNGPGFTDRFGNPVFDPVKRDLEKLKSEAKQAKAINGGGGGLELDEGPPMGRDTLGHQHWSKIEATPFYDRAAKVMDKIAAGEQPKVRKGTKTNIDLTDYEFPSGPVQTTKELHGLYGRGKRTFGDWQPGGSLFKAGE
jgi:hypothetical protein